MVVVQPGNYVIGLIIVHAAVNFCAIAGRNNSRLRNVKLRAHLLQSIFDAFRSKSYSFSDINRRCLVIEADGYKRHFSNTSKL